MSKYYVNETAQNNGDHEVHKEGCYWLGKISRKKYLGTYLACYLAVVEAKKYYSRSNGCKTCSNECHTS